jgi:hypothetical protein
MKKLQTIAQEYIEITKHNRVYSSIEYSDFNFYSSVVSHNGDDYHCVYFSNHKSRNKDVIEITQYDDEPKYVIDIIKKIEPLAVITYYEKTVTFTEKKI